MPGADARAAAAAGEQLPPRRRATARADAHCGARGVLRRLAAHRGRGRRPRCLAGSRIRCRPGQPAAAPGRAARGRAPALRCNRVAAAGRSPLRWSCRAGADRRRRGAGACPAAPPARRRRPMCEVVGEARRRRRRRCSGWPRRCCPDALFLDVQMPERERLRCRRVAARPGGPALVFVTAYDRYALQAFDAACGRLPAQARRAREARACTAAPAGRGARRPACAGAVPRQYSC